MSEAGDRFGSSKLGASASDASATIASMASDAGDQLVNAAGQAQEVAQVKMDKLAACIRRNPLQSAGIAAGVGFVIAWLARR